MTHDMEAGGRAEAGRHRATWRRVGGRGGRDGRGPMRQVLMLARVLLDVPPMLSMLLEAYAPS